MVRRLVRDRWGLPDRPHSLRRLAVHLSVVERMKLDDEGPDITIMPIAWIKAACFALAVIVVGVFSLGRWSAPAPAVLPAKVQASITRHTITSVVDTVTTNRLQR